MQRTKIFEIVSHLSKHSLIADSCGQFSETRGYWDYCLFQEKAKPDYASLNWEEKTDLLWDKVLSSEPSVGPRFAQESKQDKDY